VSRRAPVRAPCDVDWRALPGGVGAAALATDAETYATGRFRLLWA